MGKAPSGRHIVNMNDDTNSEVHERASGNVVPLEAAVPPSPSKPEPWLHPWHDQLGLLYHRAFAEKIRCRPSLLDVAKENLQRWIKSEPEAPPSRARREWHQILETKSVDEITHLMTDPSEDGHRRRQSTPFAGILMAGPAVPRLT
jgi:hypothetical protein